jgi:hypothetical protein
VRLVDELSEQVIPVRLWRQPVSAQGALLSRQD